MEKPAGNNAAPALEILELRARLASHLSLSRLICGICCVEQRKIPRIQNLFCLLPVCGAGIMVEIWSVKLGPGSSTMRAAATLLIHKEAKKNSELDNEE